MRTVRKGIERTPLSMQSISEHKPLKQSVSSESMMGKRCSMVRPEGPGVAPVQCFLITVERRARSMLLMNGALGGR